MYIRPGTLLRDIGAPYSPDLYTYSETTPGVSHFAELRYDGEPPKDVFLALLLCLFIAGVVVIVF